MKLERKTNTSTKPSWRKITQGTLYPFPTQRNRRVKFKETVQATPEELGNKINQFELVEPGSGEYKIDTDAFAIQKEEAPAADVVKTPTPPVDSSIDEEEYEVKHAGGGWYNVVSSTGKVMNSEKLRSTDAQDLKTALEEHTPGDGD